MKVNLGVGVLVAVCMGGCTAHPWGGEEGARGPSTEAVPKANVREAGHRACSTAVVRALSEQLIAEMNCMVPGLMNSLEGIPGVNLGPAVMPYLQTPAAEALERAASRSGGTIWVNSAYRTIAQQYLLYRWYREGRCGIFLAAPPGGSNHESGLALDIDNYSSLRNTMNGAGFRWFGGSDPVHFDYARGGRDLRSLSVRAFQRLWNLNHPEDRISEDGDFGWATESRLARAPSRGFARGATCDEPARMSAPEGAPPESTGPSPDSEMAGCVHRNGGRYESGGCTSGYQCCDGWWDTRGSCGACTCIEPWGTRGCGGETSSDTSEPMEPAEPPTPAPPTGASCRHANGGNFRDQGCTQSYQCCDGAWQTRGSCGSCACTDAWGERGC